MHRSLRCTIHAVSQSTPLPADWEEEWEETAASAQDDPALWTREQREAYRVGLLG